jgi:two-component system, OmpR family, sensor kinase
MNVRRIFKNYYPALLVFFCLTAFTVFSYYELTTSVRAKREKLFEQRGARAIEVLRVRIIDYIQILRGCQALFYASDSVTRDNWEKYVKNLNISVNYPGIQALAYAVYINKREISGVENRLRRSGYPYFKINSNFRNDYLTPIIFIEPFSGRNLRAFGFDMYSESIRREAMDRALETGQPAMSKKVTLMQETSRGIQPGFLLYIPVYRSPDATKTIEDRKRNIIGFVYTPFRAHDVMQAILKNFSDLQIQIYDGNKPSKENILFNSGSILHQTSSKKDFVSDTSIYPAGTQWKIILSTTDAFGSNIEQRHPALVLLLGLAVTFLMLLISINIIRNKATAVKELLLSREVEKKKDEFIGIASHELKTPLTSIKAYIQLLERSDLKETERMFVRKAISQIKKLSTLIADLLDVSKIQAGSLQLHVQTFLLADLISESIETVNHIYTNHQIVIDSELPHVQMSGDKFRLEQALNNLLNNAIKYSPGSNTIYINGKQINDHVEIEVRDEGIGISTESQNRIFEKFYRAEGLSQSLSGLGMGLYISNEIVRRHKGKITVSSVLDKGSIFTMHIPVNPKLDDSISKG